MVALTLLCLVKSLGCSKAVLNAQSRSYILVKSTFTEALFPFDPLSEFVSPLPLYCPSELMLDWFESVVSFLPLDFPKLPTVCGCEGPLEQLGGVDSPLSLESFSCLGICGWESSLLLSFPFLSAVLDEVTEVPEESFDLVLILSCDPPSVSLFPSVLEEEESSLLSD